MNKVKELKTTKGLVKAILTDVPQTRNSDSLLYLKVLQRIAETNDINIENLSVPAFLLELENSQFPCFESVRRARQKLQVSFPELAASKKVQEFRAENEYVYGEFARSVT